MLCNTSKTLTLQLRLRAMAIASVKTARNREPVTGFRIWKRPSHHE